MIEINLMDTPFDNPALALLRRAQRERWCARPGCTTCGGLQYRRALSGLRDELGEGFGQALARMDLDALQRLRRWPDLLRRALSEASAAGQLDEVLRGWLPEIRHHPWVADVVLFYFVRRGTLFTGMSGDVHRAWREACVEMAVAWDDASLLESLLYTSPSSLLEHPEGRAAAERVAERNEKVRRALRKAGAEGKG